MNEQIYELNVAGRILRYRFRDPRAALWFTLPLTPGGQDSNVLEIDGDILEQGRKRLPAQVSDVALEYKLLLAPTARQLLRERACIFHSVAFIWRGLAWLLSATSGVGKTTQFRRWRELYGEEVQIISGDMPILTLEADGRVQVNPSPWPGKERWYGNRSAPLGGVILLEQAAENEIICLEPQESFNRMTGRIMCRPDTEEEIRCFAELFDAILANHPVWLLRNLGDPASAQLTEETLEAYLAERNKQ